MYFSGQSFKFALEIVGMGGREIGEVGFGAGMLVVEVGEGGGVGGKLCGADGAFGAFRSGLGFRGWGV